MSVAHASHHLLLFGCCVMHIASAITCCNNVGILRSNRLVMRAPYQTRCIASVQPLLMCHHSHLLESVCWQRRRWVLCCRRRYLQKPCCNIEQEQSRIFGTLVMLNTILDNGLQRPPQEHLQHHSPKSCWHSTACNHLENEP